MKYCPKCRKQFDVTFDFCLDDGVPLVYHLGDDQPTIISGTRISDPVGVRPERGRTGSWVFPVIGLMGGALVVLGFLAFWGFRPQEAGTNNAVTTVSPTALPQNAVATAQNAPPPVAAPGNTRYSGDIGGTAATFNLTWSNSRVWGNFYYNSSPDVVYAVTGTNPQTGFATATVRNGNNVVGSMTLNKSLGALVCWSGQYNTSGNLQSINFCRRR